MIESCARKYEQSVTQMLDEVVAWSAALKPMRKRVGAGVPG